MHLSANVEGGVELNQNTLCVYGLSVGLNSEMAEYINLELSRDNKRDNQMTKKAIFDATTATTTSVSAFMDNEHPWHVVTRILYQNIENGDRRRER